MSNIEKHNTRTGFEIAVIGMSGTFPGAKDINEFWNNLKNGVESISFFSDKVLEERGVDPELIKDPNYVKAYGICKDKEFFDASFFGFTPKEAEIMDPQVRIFFECAWNALEDAGYNSENYGGSIGLFAGASPNFIWEASSLLSGRSNINSDIGQFAPMRVTSKDFLSTQVSYKLNLKGPSISINTACSTSLVATHMACRALLGGECDMALAGGVSISTENIGYLYQEGMILSPDGHCRAFDANAKGTIGGEGAGVVVLKELGDAIKDGDNIYAIIKGSAINNDGLRKVGFTAPSVKGQVEVIRAAQHIAEIEAESISYVEAHGTATVLGDPIEIEALKLAFNTDKKGFCGIGSVKTNIGHLDDAAGVAGLIKVILALKHRQIPPSLHFEKPNPKIDFENSPFYVNTRLREWENSKYPLRAGVSSFGIGGTNAHVILEEAPEIEDFSESRALQLLLLSAQTESALNKTTENLAEFLMKNPEVNLADVAYTLQLGRKAFQYRRMLVCSDVNEAIDALTAPDPGKVNTFLSKEEKRPVIFMFSGQGAQYINMGLELYRSEPVFQEEIDHCCNILKKIKDIDLKKILYPTEIKDSKDKINQTEFTQPLLFILEYALAGLLMKWGIKPYAMIGHSIGEYVAACLAGVFSLEDALHLVALRGSLMQKMPAGLMLSIPLPEDKIKPLLPEGLSLAAVNSSSLCVISGPKETIDTFRAQLKEKGHNSTYLHTSHAFHSAMMAPILKEFEEQVSKITLNKPTMPYISNVSGYWIKVEEATSPRYWAKHIRETVRFADGLKVLLKKEDPIFIELGPGRALSTFVRQHSDKKDGQNVINLLRHPKEEISDLKYLLTSLGQLWLYGESISWPQFYAGEKRHRISLPTYPFEGQRYWIEENPFKLLGDKILSQQNQLAKRPDIADWFYFPSWKRSVLPVHNKDKTFFQICMLVFIDDTDWGHMLVKCLENNYQHVIVVKRGTEFTKKNNHEYYINPQQNNDYNILFKELNTTGKIPEKIVHLWSITEGFDNNVQSLEQIRKANNSGFYSLLYLVQAIQRQNLTNNFQIIVITNNIHQVIGEERLYPEKAPMLGLVKVIPQEFPGISCRSIDVNFPESGNGSDKLIDQLLLEISVESPDTVVAYRNNLRWVQTFETVRLNEDIKAISKLKDEGVYLITGGLGAIGLILAEYLAKTRRAKLILTGRANLPEKKEWEKWLSTHNEDDNITRKILKIQEIEKKGGEVLFFSADVANEDRMKEIITQAEKRFGLINGVIHAAGVTKGRSLSVIEQIGKTECEEQFRPKIYGLIALERILKDRKLDFCLLMSSVSSILGGLGFAAYSAANIFMDTFVNYHNRTDTNHWISVNWDGWRFDEQEEQKMPGANLSKLAITGKEGVNVFEKILSTTINQFVISTSDLQIRIDQWIKPKYVRDADHVEKKEAVTLQSRPNLPNPYVAPGNQLEKTIAVMWQELIGFDQIGIYDDFFELGGDSLKGINLISTIQKKLHVRIPLSEVFNNPTIYGLSRYIESKSKDKKKKYYPLSSSQKRLYFLQQMGSSNVSYNMAYIIPLNEDINKKKLEETFRKLIARHESLRTSFLIIDNVPVQKIHEEVPFSIEYYETDDGGLIEIINNFTRPFDLSHAPLFRIGFVKISYSHSILLVDMHHIITDRISQNILEQEFKSLYAGEELSELRLQYKDFLEWQNKDKESESMKKMEEYWLKEFEGEIPILRLPTDYKRPAYQSFKGSSVSFEIGEQKSNALKKLALEEGITLFMALFSIYNVFLSKISGQEDIVVGTPIAGCRLADYEKITGMFENTLALRNYPKGEKIFTKFLNEVKINVLNAFENQDYPSEELINKLGVNRAMSYNPLFNVAFSFQNVSINLGKTLGEEAPFFYNKPLNYRIVTSKFDLTLIAMEAGNKLFFIFEYCSKLFIKKTIERYINYFKQIISTVTDNKNIKLNQIKISHDLIESKSAILEDIKGDFVF